jgi:hypothetical protein
MWQKCFRGKQPCKLNVLQCEYLTLQIMRRLGVLDVAWRNCTANITPDTTRLLCPIYP